MRSLAVHTRVLAYNRAGLPPSSPAPPQQQPRTSLDIAEDLETLLEKTGIAPPYILLAHSYGGIQIRTWMEVHGRMDEVVGMVFVDTVAGDTYGRMPIREREWGFLFALDYGRVTGLDERYKLLTREEYEGLKKERGSEVLATDDAAERLRGYRQYERVVLEDKAVSVIVGDFAGDLRKLCQEARRVGLGTEEQRRRVEDSLDLMDEVMKSSQGGQLRLSTKGRVVLARGAGHVPFLTEPDIVLKEIRWVIDEYWKEISPQ